jgi:hypothetical protein
MLHGLSVVQCGCQIAKVLSILNVFVACLGDKVASVSFFDFDGIVIVAKKDTVLVVVESLIRRREGAKNPICALH